MAQDLKETQERSLAGQICEYIKLFVATCVVFLLVAVACVGIGNRWCILDIHPAGGFIVLLMALTLLAYCEALHYACKFSTLIPITIEIGD